MDKTIWKFPLKSEDYQRIKMPFGAEILSVQTQNETPCIWALVNPQENEIEERRFELFGTGHFIQCDDDKNRKFIGTFQLGGGALVFHLFERI